MNKILKVIKGFFKVKPCECTNCITYRNDMSKYTPCIHAPTAIKLAHHKAEIKTKKYIAHVKKGLI